jgi:hypothetical protein
VGKFRAQLFEFFLIAILKFFFLLG